jgi:hypothetical protein
MMFRLTCKSLFCKVLDMTTRAKPRYFRLTYRQTDTSAISEHYAIAPNVREARKAVGTIAGARWHSFVELSADDFYFERDGD